MSIGSRMLSEFDEEFSSTRKFLELVPDEKLTWKPHDKSMEMGRLAWHLADFPSWCTETMKRDLVSMTAEDAEKSMHGWKGKTREEILAKFDKHIAEARAALENATDADWANHWKMEWAGQVVVDSPREAVIRKWVLNHLSTTEHSSECTCG